MAEPEFGENVPLTTAMACGAASGVMEHVCMFPVDTIKTRLQVGGIKGMPLYNNVFHAGSKIVRTEGIKQIYRGLPAAVFAAIPSHAAYFGTLEYVKKSLGSSSDEHHVFANAFTGAAAVMAHDFVVTPMDVVKQRLQLYKSHHVSVTSCLRHIIKKEGALSLYRSYPTTLLLNVPFMSSFYASYEAIKLGLHRMHMENKPGVSGIIGRNEIAQDFVASGCAGALAGFVSTPLDVVKTRIQVHAHLAPDLHSSGKGIPNTPLQMIKEIYRESGSRGFFRGATARALYQMPSAVICWTTYESLKKVFNIEEDGVSVQALSVISGDDGLL